MEFKSYYCPRWRGFKFMVPLNAFLNIQFTKAGSMWRIEGPSRTALKGTRDTDYWVNICIVSFFNPNTLRNNEYFLSHFYCNVDSYLQLFVWKYCGRMQQHLVACWPFLNKKERDILPKCFRRDQLEKSRLFENCKKWHIIQVDNLSAYWVLLAYYTVSSGNYLLTFRDNLKGQDQSRNVGKELPLLAA